MLPSSAGAAAQTAERLDRSVTGRNCRRARQRHDHELSSRRQRANEPWIFPTVFGVEPAERQISRLPAGPAQHSRGPPDDSRSVSARTWKFR